jgi:predicted ATP-grasp superfamily ATP-dependent carboligase
MKREPSKINILFLSEVDFITMPVLRSLDQAFCPFVMGPSSSAVRFSRFCTRYFNWPVFSPENKEELMTKYINKVSVDYNIAALIPLDMNSTFLIAGIWKNLKVSISPISTPDQLARLHNKSEFKVFLDELGLAHPKTSLVKNTDDIAKVNFTKPFLIKPLTQDSGRGIVKIGCQQDLEKFYRSRSPYKEFPFIIQEYIFGSDVDLSLLAEKGKILAWTVQRWRQPGYLEFIDSSEIYAIGEKIVKHADFSGFMHLDLRIDKERGRVLVLECNPRAWGTINASVITGVDFIKLGISCALGKSMAQIKPEKVSYLTPYKFLVTLLVRPWAIRKISRSNKTDFVRVLTDPLLYVILSLRELKKIAIRIIFYR